jgi:hypothetical protein
MASPHDSGVDVQCCIGDCNDVVPDVGGVPQSEEVAATEENRKAR